MRTRRQILALSALGLSTALTSSARSAPVASPGAKNISLDGIWQAGFARNYDRVVKVPGLASDPTKPTPGTLWYKRTVDVPKGRWTRATLTLKGARFAPKVYIDGELVSQTEGGMAPTVHKFTLPKNAAGHPLTVEIALCGLEDLDPKDASAVPQADRWRNNVSSYLWDSVHLRLHGECEIIRVLPFNDLLADQVCLRWELSAPLPKAANIAFKILDVSGKTVVESDPQKVNECAGETTLVLNGRIMPWSPEQPNLYRLVTQLTSSGQIVDISEQAYGLREFAVKGLGFELNHQVYPIRMGTIVWHRWTRDPEARDIAFDTDWFEANVVLPLKHLGANALRFHLGLPPESLLDLCDRHGLAVQAEWPFFHGINSTEASMETQWRSWLDVLARHPSAVIIHPWNETGGDQLKPAIAAIATLRPQYPPLVMSHAELTPVHKYWWSLFENLGLYYDSADQFRQAVMVDEFGGNYLDGNGNPGGYPTTRETFLRFLGRNHTLEDRLQLQADANGRVAEYWRRLGVAGFSPFTILGSLEDGNHWFLGPTNVPSPRQKPVWQALSAAFAPVSLSLEIWNRSFSPGELLELPMWFFNDSDQDTDMQASLHILHPDTREDVMPVLRFAKHTPARSMQKQMIRVALPKISGEWRIEARLDAPEPLAGIPVASSWNIRTYLPQPTARLKAVKIGIATKEIELRAALKRLGLRTVALSDRSAKIMVGSSLTWAKLRQPENRKIWESRLNEGVSVVLLDAGPQPLGVGYEPLGQLGGPLEGAPTISHPETLEEASLFGGVKVTFVEMPEPESTLQKASEDTSLWAGLPREAGWLWNGLRGGLIVPAADMHVTGLSGKALLAVWQDRGADVSKIAEGDYFAYELAGYYAYAPKADDKVIYNALRQRVTFLVEDAPALAGVVNPNAPITITNLNALYQQSQSDGQAESLIPMANAGKNLSRAPVIKLKFGRDSGQLVVSQLLTKGRLLPDVSESGPGVYGRRYDPVTVQFVLNMLDSAL